MKHSLKQSKSQSARLNVIGTCAVLLLLASAQAGQAQQAASPKPAVSGPLATLAAAHAIPKPAVEDEEPAKPGKSGEQGIKVHGHWKIIVANPDGTVASTREFENSLIPGFGDQFIAQLLTGRAAFGGISVIISGSGECGSGGCHLEPVSSLGTCQTNGNCPNLLTDSDCSQSGTTCFPGLSITYNPASTTTSGGVTTLVPASVTLQGSFTNEGAETFGQVATNFFGCLSSSVSTVSAATCGSSGTSAPAGTSESYGQFTGQTISPALSASNGQVVTVVVTISFS